MFNTKAALLHSYYWIKINHSSQYTWVNDNKMYNRHGRHDFKSISREITYGSSIDLCTKGKLMIVAAIMYAVREMLKLHKILFNWEIRRNTSNKSRKWMMFLLQVLLNYTSFGVNFKLRVENSICETNNYLYSPFTETKVVKILKYVLCYFPPQVYFSFK